MRRAAGVALAGVMLTLVAMAFDVPPLFVPGIAFALLGAGAPLSVVLVARGARVTRHVATRRVIEREPFEIEIEVRSRLRLLVPEIHDPIVRGALVPTRGEGTIRTVATLERRGRYRFPPPSLLIGDPLQIARCRAPADGPATELLVLPRVAPVRTLGGGGTLGERAGVLADHRTAALAAVDLDGLRPYRTGTPAARIHWPALARGAGLLERRLRVDTDRRPLLVLDARGAPGTEQLDAAVRAAASLTLELARAGGCDLLLPGARRYTPIGRDLAAWPGAHARLALVQAHSSAPALGIGAVRLGAVVYVAARALERAPQALVGLARGQCMLVLPAGVPAPAMGGRAPAPSFEVAGCLVYGVRLSRPSARRERHRAGRSPE